MLYLILIMLILAYELVRRKRGREGYNSFEAFIWCREHNHKGTTPYFWDEIVPKHRKRLHRWANVINFLTFRMPTPPSS